MKINESSKVFLPLLLSLIIIIIIFIAVSIYKPPVSQESLVQGLTDFYRYDYYNVIKEQQNQLYCDIEMKVNTASNSVLVNSNCIAEYPYSAFEAFYAVARGDISAEGSTLYTNLDWEMSNEEAFESRLEFIQYPFFATITGEIPDISPTFLCFVPCLDEKGPTLTDVLSVEYKPDKEQTSRLFKDYSLDNFRDLTFYGDYKYMLYYESAEHGLKWRYLMGQFDFGRFRLEIEVDKPVLSIENQREDIKTLEEIPEYEYEITKVSENKFIVSGSGTGIDVLVVEW